MQAAMKKVWNVFSTVIVILIVLCAIFLMASRIMGYRVFNVLTGSMEPNYSVGDLIYVEEVSPEEVKVGDVITFVLNEDLAVATHRVVAIDTEKEVFYTKGDVNKDIDEPVLFKNLIGKPQFSIPLLGYVSDFIQNPPGMYITIAIGAVLVIVVFVPDMVAKKKKDETIEEASAEATDSPET